jgi:hypothetical protein
MEIHSAEKSNKREFETTKGRESRIRREQWRKIAALEARKNPSLSAVQIAAYIQRSKAGRKREGNLTYSIDFILRSIRGALIN